MTPKSLVLLGEFATYFLAVLQLERGPPSPIVVLSGVYHRVLFPRVIICLEEAARVGAGAEVPSKARDGPT